MKIAISGGSGFIGTKLTDRLVDQGHTVYILTRNAANKPAKSNVKYVEWLKDDTKPEVDLEGIDAFVNLAGESIGDGRWTSERKKQILESRIDSTRAVMDVLNKLNEKPDVLVNASAIGYYGNSQTETFTEDSPPIEMNFLADVVQKWEAEAAKASELGIRVAYCRLGIVLDKNEGALNRMLLPYRLFIGGTIGSGEQWLSWVHIDDVVGMFQFAIEHEEVEGPMNVTAPSPIQMKDFGKQVASVLNRPHWIPAPAFALKIILGEMSTLVLDGQKVLPKKSEELNYPYDFLSLKPALENLLK